MNTEALPKISIVIPSFNQGQFIEQTLNSVIGQNYPNLELIVIDGGSTDETLSILEKYSSFITYYISEPDKGQANAINKGFRLATGKIFGWLNSDDMYLPYTLLRIAKVLKNDEEPNLVYGGCLHIFEGQTYAYGTIPDDFDQNRLTYYDFISQPSTFWSRKLWEKTGELNESYNYVLDWEWFIRASKFCNFIPIKELLSIYRFHENHKTGIGGDVRAKEIAHVVDQYADTGWSSAYQDVSTHAASLKKWLAYLLKFKLYRYRILLYPQLYLKHGKHRVDTALSMIRL